MLSFERSDNLKSISEYNPEPIHLFQQFFIHNDADRQKEIELCLKKNVENNFIDKIYLLNERIYKEDELKVSSKKIIQKKIKTRLTYKKLFNYIHKKNINGYIVFSNSDIFLDDTINKIRKTEFHKKKNFIGLLRYDYGKGLCYKGGKSSNSKQSIKQVDEELYKKHSLLYAFGQKLNNQPHILKIIKDLLPTQDLLKDGEQVGDNISPDYIVLFQDLIKIKTNSTIYR